MQSSQQTAELRERLHRMATYDSQDFDSVVRIPLSDKHSQSDSHSQSVHMWWVTRQQHHHGMRRAAMRRTVRPSARAQSVQTSCTSCTRPCTAGQRLGEGGPDEQGVWRVHGSAKLALVHFMCVSSSA